MALSDVSIRHPVFAWMLMAALMLFGIIGYSRMGVSQLPNVDFPTVTITLNWQGAAPEVMETDVVKVVEDAVTGIQGVNNISSTARQGTATVTIEFLLGRSIDAAVQDVQNSLTQAQNLLPKNMDPPIVTRVNPEDEPVVWLSLSSDLPLRDLIRYVQENFKDEFSTIPGAGEVVLGGYVDPNLRVWLDDTKMHALQITAEDVVTAIQQQHQEIPAGIIETPTQERNIRVMGEAPTPTDFGSIIIDTRGNQPIYKTIRLSDIATVEKGLADLRQAARAGGTLALGVGIRKQRGANEVAVAKAVLKRLDEVRPRIPKNIRVSVAFDSTRFILDSIRELVFTLVLSAIVTSLVCWLFLGSWSATLNILLAIPTSILGTFFVIYFLGFTLNSFTVLGLTLAVGIVVDDAIMVLENIVRHREGGEEKVRAALNGSRQITLAATAATLALIAIFLPVAFISGIVGKFFFQYGVTISIAVLLSLLEALTLTPMRCSQFLEVEERTTWLGKGVERSFHGLSRLYRIALAWALGHRWLVLLVTLAVFIVSLGIVGFLRKEFVPSQDMSILLIRAQTPEGSSFAYTNERFQEIERVVGSRPEVDHYLSVLGGFTGGEVNSGFMFITLKAPKKRPIVPPATHRLSQQELMGVFRQELNRIPNVQAFVQDLSQAGFSSERGLPVEFAIYGPDWNTLTASSLKLREAMAKTGLMTDIDSDYRQNVPEVQVVPDRTRAAGRGVNIETIGKTINTMIGGEAVGKYTEGDQRYDIRVRLKADQRNQVSDIDRLQVWNNRGELVTLRDVVNIRQVPAVTTITRRNRQRAVSIFANVAPGKSQSVALQEVQRLSQQILPPGYRTTLTGSAQTFQQSFISLVFVLLLGIIVSYMVLASQFNSYLHPLIVLLALPFSITGALIALLIGNQSLNIYSFIGLILLMGIVKKNSILLVDFTNQYRHRGSNVHDALVEACPLRLRPILMTSVATIVAALPPALALGPGAEIRVPMAIAVIGGVIFSTGLTLLAVPCAYSLFSRDIPLTQIAPEVPEGGHE